MIRIAPRPKPVAVILPSIGCIGTAVAIWKISEQMKQCEVLERGTKNLRAVQLLLGNTKLQSTVRYLGIEVDDALEMAGQTEV